MIERQHQQVRQVWVQAGTLGEHLMHALSVGAGVLGCIAVFGVGALLGMWLDGLIR